MVKNISKNYFVSKIKKRDGSIVNFEKERIVESIFKAAKSVGGNNKGLSEVLADEVISIIDKKFLKTIPSIEEVQDIIEKVLIERGYAKTAKAYIIYRQKHKELRDAKQMLLDSEKVINNYISNKESYISDNANINYSIGGLLWNGIGTIMSNYGLNEVYSREISRAHLDGDFHIHKLNNSLTGYCAGWSLKQLLQEGLNGVPLMLECAPAKHLVSAIDQMINFIEVLQNEWAAAQSFSSFDTYLAPFVKYDKLDFKDIKQTIQKFIYNVNLFARSGSRGPFTTLSFDLNVPTDLKDKKVIVGGKLQRETYSDFEDEMELINKAFIEIMNEGDAKGKAFTFPIPTYNLDKKFKWNDEISDKLFEMTSKYGLPYFQNSINSDIKQSDVREITSRSKLNIDELSKNITGGLFGSGELTGSIGAITINLSRIGHNSKNEKDFFEKLGKTLNLAKNALEIKRKVVERNVEKNLLPYTKRYIGTLNKHFSTIGIVGMNEACMNFLREDIASKRGKEFAIDVLKFIRKEILNYQEETGNMYNLEATPAEGCAYRLAKLDKQQFPKIITAGKYVPYYTNSSQLPVDYTNDLFFALKHQEALQKLYTGGTAFHTFLEQSIGTNECKILVKKIANNFTLPYFTITPTFSICSEHGYLKGKQEKCHQCKKDAEIYSRVVGYLRPVKNWNTGKQEEFRQRSFFNINK